MLCLVKTTRKSVVTELSIRSNKHFQLSNIFRLFINRPYFAEPKNFLDIILLSKFEIHEKFKE